MLTARLALLGAACLALSGCQTVAGTAASEPAIRLIDAAPNQPLGLDYYLNKTAVAYNLGFTSATNYIPVVAGTYTASVAQSGTTNTLTSIGFTATGSGHYTVIAGNTPGSLEMHAYTDQSTPAPSNQISVRFLDQSQNNGAVDIYMIPSGGKLTTTLPTLTGVTFDTNTGYIALPSGTYQIAIVPTGTVPISTTVTLATGAQTAYTAGDVVTFLLTDNLVATTPTLNILTLKPYDFGSDY